jgi:serine/threonine protein kinase
MSEHPKGTVFNDRYTILERIGKGGMSRVYRAIDQTTSQCVAVKILSAEFLSRNPKEAERNLRRFRREGTILGMLRGSPHVVELVEHACSRSGDWYIAMELLEGEQLAHYIGRGDHLMPAGAFIRLAIHLVEGLKEIHAKKIIHRDLSPDNLILVKGKDDHLFPKFLDFGIGKSLDNDLDPITQMLTIMGKPQYFSPEQARGLELTTASDIYALGVMLYEMATGRIPIEIRGMPDFRRLQREPPLPIGHCPGGMRFPFEVQDVIMRTLAKDPGQRPLSDEILEVLRETRDRIDAGEDFESSDALRPGIPSPTYSTEIELHPGNHVGRYEIRSILGRGGMGTVYLAWDPVLHRQIAIKVATKVEDEASKKILLREARASSALRSEHIVTIYDAGKDEGTPYIAMEFVEGQTLAEIIDEEGPLQGERLWEIAREICEGLAFAHDRDEPVIHGDLKPGNILVHRLGVKITDFGLAQILSGFQVGVRGETAVQALPEGTVATMSPEQANGLPLDPRSDLYSLGCVLYMMATRRQPFQGNQIAILYQHCTTDPPPPSQFVPSIPPALDHIILKLLAKKPEDRFQSAERVLLALRRVFEPDRVPAGRRWIPAALVFLAIAGVGAVIALSAYWRDQPTRLDIVESAQYRPGSDWLVKAPYLTVRLVGAHDRRVRFTVEPENGDATVTEAAFPKNGILTPTLLLNPRRDVETLQKFTVTMEDEEGRVAELRVHYDGAPPHIIAGALTSPRRTVEGPVATIELLPKEDIAIEIRDTGAGIALPTGDVAEVWHFRRGDELPPGIEMTWVDRRVTITASDRAGNERGVTLSLPEVLPVVSVPAPRLYVSGPEAPIAVGVTVQDSEVALEPGQLVAILGTERFPLRAESGGRYSGLIPLERVDGSLSSQEVTFEYGGRPLAATLSIVRDDEPPSLAVTHIPDGTRVDAQSGAPPAFVKRQGIPMAALFEVEVEDAGGVLETLEVTYAEGAPIPLPIPDVPGAKIRLPDGVPLDLDAFDVLIVAKDRAGNRSEVRFPMRSLRVSLSEITLDGRPPRDDVLYASRTQGATLRVQTERMPEDGILLFALDDGPGRPFDRDGGSWILPDVGLTETETRMRRGRIILQGPHGDAVDLLDVPIVLDRKKPTLSTQVFGSDATLPTLVTWGAFHSLTILATDDHALADRSNDLVIEAIDPVDAPLPSVHTQRQPTGIAVHFEAPDGPPVRAEYRIAYQTRDAAGNASAPWSLIVRVRPPRLRVTRLGLAVVDTPGQYRDTPLPVAGGDLRVAIANDGAHDGGEEGGVFQIEARVDDGDAVDVTTLQGAVTRADAVFTLGGLVAGEGLVRLAWFQEIGEVRSPPVPFDVFAWVLDREAPVWEVWDRQRQVVMRGDETPFRPLRVRSMNDIELRVSDDRGLPSNPLAAQREGPVLSPVSVSPRRVVWRFVDRGKAEETVDLHINDLAGNQVPVRFQVHRFADEPLLSAITSADGDPLPNRFGRTWYTREGRVRAIVVNETVGVESVHLEVLDVLTESPVLQRDVVRSEPTIDIELIRPGRYELRLFARRAATGLDARPFESVDLVLDSAPPGIGLWCDGVPLGESATIRAFRRVSLLINDDGDLEPQLKWSLQPVGQPPVWESLVLDPDETMVSLPDRDLAAGDYRLRVIARDRAGREGRLTQGLTLALPAALPGPLGGASLDPDVVRARTGLDAVPITHPVTGVVLFHFSRTEVTVGQFTRFHDAFLRDPASLLDRLRDAVQLGQLAYEGWSYADRGAIEADVRSALSLSRSARSDDVPIRFVTREVAAAFTFWAEGRLPTLDEWRNAAGRLHDPTAQWPVYLKDGKILNQDGGLVARMESWANVNTGNVREVGVLAVGSPFGLLGMVGNVSEWVLDEKRVGTIGGSAKFRATSSRLGARLDRPLRMGPLLRPEDCDDVGIRVCWPAAR